MINFILFLLIFSASKSMSVFADHHHTNKHLLFSYGSNNIHQLEERTGATGLIPIKAYLSDHIRIFGGYSGSRIGAPAAVHAKKGKRVYGSVVKMTEVELQLLDYYEGTHSKPPIYVRERRKVFVIEDEDKHSEHECFIYIKQEVNFLSYPNYEAYIIPIERHFHSVRIAPHEDDLNHIHVLDKHHNIRTISLQDIKTDYLFLYDGALSHGMLSLPYKERTVDLRQFAPRKAFLPNHTRIYAGHSQRYGDTPSGMATLHPQEGHKVYGVLIHMNALNTNKNTTNNHQQSHTLDDQAADEIITKNDLLAALDMLYRVDQRSNALYHRELIDVFPVMTKVDEKETAETAGEREGDEEGEETLSAQPVRCFVYVKIDSTYKEAPNERYLQNMQELVGMVDITAEEDPSLTINQHLSKSGQLISQSL